MKLPPLLSGRQRANVPPEEKGQPYSTLLQDTCRVCYKQLVGSEQVVGICTWCMFHPPVSFEGLKGRKYGNPKKR
jgi:hypothetical protein